MSLSGTMGLTIASPSAMLRRLLAVGLIASQIGAAQASCGSAANFSLPDGGRQRQVFRLRDSLLFTAGIKVNTDGAANSYHPDGTDAGALNTICNGVAVTPNRGPYAGRRISAQRPRDISGRERCRVIREMVAASRSDGWSTGPAMIEWFAIAQEGPPQGGRYRPCIQQAGPYRGFFVAQTSRAADPGRPDCDPEHWISATAIPYITLPGDRLRPYGMRIGDMALVHRRVGGRDLFVAAVAADTGNRDELGEGSVALHLALGNPLQGRLPENIADGVTTFLFPRRVASRPISAASVAAERQTMLDALGGEAELLRCLANQ